MTNDNFINTHYYNAGEYHFTYPLPITQTVAIIGGLEYISGLPVSLYPELPKEVPDIEVLTNRIEELEDLLHVALRIIEKPSNMPELDKCYINIIKDALLK